MARESEGEKVSLTVKVRAEELARLDAVTEADARPGALTPNRSETVRSILREGLRKRELDMKRRAAMERTAG